MNFDVFFVFSMAGAAEGSTGGGRHEAGASEKRLEDTGSDR